MPLRRIINDPAVAAAVMQQLAVKDAVALLAQQINAAAADVERIVQQEILRAAAPEPELERNSR